jgi:hypothetical protein
MPDHFLHRVFDDPAFPSLEIAVRFDSLRRYLEQLLEFVPHMKGQTLVRFAAVFERRKAVLSPEDLADEIAHTKSVVEDQIPVSFYGAFVLTLFATLEQSIQDVAKYVRASEKSPLTISDLREPGTIKRLQLYLQTLLREPLAVAPSLAADIRALQLVRNALAHANGALSGMPEKRIEELEQVVRHSPDLKIENFTLVIYAQYLTRSLEAADTLVEALLQQVDKHYPIAPSAA